MREVLSSQIKEKLDYTALKKKNRLFPDFNTIISSFNRFKEAKKDICSARGAAF